MDCPQCGSTNPFGALVCAACGHALALASTSGAVLPATPDVAFDPAPVRVQTAPREPSVYGPMPGPADRESFFAAQRRNRRATWRLVAMSAVAAVLTGIPLSLVLTPLLFAVVLIATRLAGLVLPVPDAVWSAYEWVGLALKRVFDAVGGDTTTLPPVGDMLLVAVVWLMPGIVAMLAIWVALRTLFERAGVGGMLLSLDAREPRPDDFEERQLVNVVEEMAIAAGIRPPRVMLIDSPIANAAMLGASVDDAALLVARPMLDTLDRDETQGLLAHLVASIANGDLDGAQSMLAVFQTYGFASALIRAPISGPARATVFRTLRYIASPKRGTERLADGRALAGMLADTVEDFADQGDDLDSFVAEDAPPAERPGPGLSLLLFFPLLLIAYFIGAVLAGWPDALRNLGFIGLFILAGMLVWYQRVYALWALRRAIISVHAIVVLPYYLAAMMPQVLLGLLNMLILQPAFGLLWRTRRYLADATAVQLTRNPDGLARGLAAQAEHGCGVAGGRWASPLFVSGAGGGAMRVGPEARERFEAAVAEELARQSDAGAEGVPREMQALFNLQRRAAVMHQLAEAQGVAGAGEASQSGGFDGMVALHPSTNRRLQRLRRMGATVGDIDSGGGLRQMFSRTTGGLLAALLVVLIAIAAVLMVVAVVLLAAVSIVCSAVLMLLVYGLFAVIIPR